MSLRVSKANVVPAAWQEKIWPNCKVLSRRKTEKFDCNMYLLYCWLMLHTALHSVCPGLTVVEFGHNPFQNSWRWERNSKNLSVTLFVTQPYLSFSQPVFYIAARRRSIMNFTASSQERYLRTRFTVHQIYQLLYNEYWEQIFLLCSRERFFVFSLQTLATKKEWHNNMIFVDDPTLNIPKNGWIVFNFLLSHRTVEPFICFFSKHIVQQRQHEELEIYIADCLDRG